LKKSIISVLFSCFFFFSFAQNSFQVIVLGSGGGVDESNISSYLVAPINSENYIALDAGTLMVGLKLAVEKNLFFTNGLNNKFTDAAFILRSHIKAYVISHAHFDHIAGLIQVSPFDTKKEIYCSEKTMNHLLNNVFKNGIWANFTDRGENAIGKYRLVNTPTNQWISIPETSFEIKAFDLSHSGLGNSTAFLIKNQTDYMLYFGDTGSDIIEKSNSITTIWHEIAPLVRQKALKAIFIECSFPNSVDDEQLYGHLNPKWLGFELEKLALEVKNKNVEGALEGIKIFVTHIKPSYLLEVNNQEIITKQLSEYTYLGAEFIIAEQVKKYTF